MKARRASTFRNTLARNPIPAYFCLTYAISWSAAFVVVAPELLHHQAPGKFQGLMMFPAMLLGPPIASVTLTRLFEGKAGLRALWARIRHVPGAPGWWLAGLIPPAMVFAALLTLRTQLSPAFAPSFFPQGLFFGALAGFVEEIGWTGFALPRMTGGKHPLLGAILLGLLWGLWHLPVIDFLGTASPHGAAWPQFAAAFIAVLIALRVLIVWFYKATQSIPLAQLLHASSTASLVMFSPIGVSAGQEALWYAAYAVLLWAAAFLVGRTIQMQNLSAERPV
jgi:CAAX protease family protein